MSQKAGLSDYLAAERTFLLFSLILASTVAGTTSRS
jgi:hypothetical protein